MIDGNPEDYKVTHTAYVYQYSEAHNCYNICLKTEVFTDLRAAERKYCAYLSGAVSLSTHHDKQPYSIELRSHYYCAGMVDSFSTRLCLYAHHYELETLE